jgi:inosine/xanthosine triphosphatase
MITLVVASHNPIKVQAVLNGFRRMFPHAVINVNMVSVPSGVRPQPLSDEEALRGALNRAQNAAARMPDADYWIGIEAGVQSVDSEMMSFSWVVIRSKQLTGKGRSGAFFLPRKVADLVRQGKELGEADDIVCNRSNSKQDNGAVGLLTDNVIDRAQLYEQAVILALIPFKNQALYSAQFETPT